MSLTNSRLNRSVGQQVKGVAVSQVNPRQLCWAGHIANDWEILIYKNNELFEGCFFRWPIHHEHVIGPSIESVRHRAERRIQILERRGFKGAEWSSAHEASRSNLLH